METTVFINYISQVKPKINARISEIIQNISLSETKIEGYSYNGGKCLRSSLTHLICESLNGDRDKALDLGTAVEISHGVSLYLDDIIDDDQERRGKPSLHELKGISVAILKSFSDMSIPFELVSKYGREYVQLLSQTQRSMASGVLSEIFKTLPATNLYLNIIEKKTGRLFALAGSYGAMSGTEEKDIIDAFYDYGMHVGVAMQMADDVGDLKAIISGEKTIDPLTSSELLLLKCVHVDSLVDQLINDLKNHRLDKDKLFEILSNQKTMEALEKRVYGEVRSAQNIIHSLNRKLKYRDILISAPEEIARLKLGGK